ncbi:MAG: hypothetical protein ABJF10_08525 [Chthoniobacter sp.]|uniref:hypothetical protein n=1 Tax=Chthoniobacter sp. TaxID=2510640 RepID=UPI0032A2FB83
MAGSSNFDFTLFYKVPIGPDLTWFSSRSWDVFLSAYNASERVLKIFDAATAARKCWLICPEYGFEANELPEGERFIGESAEESELISTFYSQLNVDLSRCSLCIDLTGFIRPHLLFLLRWLYASGVKRFEALYTEPGHYKAKEKTQFSKGGIREVRQVSGFEGSHKQDTSNDLLVVGAGYDSMLIKAVAESKNHARKVQLFGLPSLRADMYQENLIRAQQAEDALGETERYFAPAHDPFVTANVIQTIVKDFQRTTNLTNLYLSPLATKAQVLGFALYYFGADQTREQSIVYPITSRYERETSRGVSRIWSYTVDFEAIRTFAGNAPVAPLRPGL